MNGIDDYTGGHDIKVALVEAARVALEGQDVDVAFGFRWPTRHNDWFAVTDTTAEIDPKTITPRRALEERLTIDVSVGSWQAGFDEDAEIRASARAFEILALVQRHIRLHDVTLGGTAQWCLPGGYQTAGETAESDLGSGRLIEIAAQFVCEHRIQ